LKRSELGKALCAQRRRDPRVELGQVKRLRSQPRDHVLLGEAVFGFVGERDRHDDVALGRELRKHLGFQTANETAAAQMPVQPLLAQLAAELVGEAGPGPEVLEPSDHPELRNQLIGVVEHGRTGQREAQAVGGDGPREPADRLGALGSRVLAVVRLIHHERARPATREGVAMGGDDFVVEDRDLAFRRARRAPFDDGDGAMGQPPLRFPLPAELH